MTALRIHLGAFAALLIIASPAVAYHVSCNYFVSATHSDDIPIMDDQTYTGQIHVDGNYTKTGDYGNYGTAAFEVDLANVTVQVTAHSHGTEYLANRFATGTGRVVNAWFGDRIVFSIPAGTYPDGVYATLRGRNQGTLSSDVGAGAMVRCYASLGGQTYDTGLLGVGIGESATIAVAEDWSLTQQIMAPGETLNSPTERNHNVSLGFFDAITWSVAHNTGSGYVTGDGDLDFPDGLRITSFTVSPGVTWVSDSGVFGGGLSAVPGGPNVAAPVLYQNAPNPFNPATRIGFNLARPTRVDLRVYDVALVRTLLAGEHRGAGPGEAPWFGRDDAGREVAAGVYFYRLEAEGAILTRRMVLVR